MFEGNDISAPSAALTQGFLTAAEMETIISFDKENPDLKIFTADAGLAQKLIDKGYNLILKDAYGGHTFVAPKRAVNFKTLNAKKKVLTEEQIRKMIEGRTKKNNE